MSPRRRPRGSSAVRSLAPLLVALGLPLAASAVAGPGRGTEGTRDGEAIYRRGVLPSGAPLTATVAGDVPLEGVSAACTTCHQRSGMGSVEGRVWVPPITAPILGASRGSGPRLRPGYDDAALARTLREGVDVAGRPLDPLMPRYDLRPEDLEALTSYLHGLGARVPPGVSEREIRFATVVTPDADPGRVQAMLDVFDGFFRGKNVQVRSLARFGTQRGTFRTWTLETWRLTGEPSGWAGQLRAFYAKDPVFALLGGVGEAEWGPVDDFCEENEVPCLLPNVDAPPASAGRSYYTLYVSRGVELEAAAVAAEIARDPSPARVVQLVPERGPGRAGADALRAALADRKDISVRNRIVVPGVFAGRTLAARNVGSSRAIHARTRPGRSRKPMPARRARTHRSKPRRRPDGRRGVALVTQTSNDGRSRSLAAAGTPVARSRRIVVFWIPPAGLARSALEGEESEDPWDRAFVSSTVLDGEPAALTARALPRSEIVHPFTRPDELGRRLANLEIWLRTRGVPKGVRRVQDQALLACTLAGDALMHEFRDFDREYFLELVDHAGSNQTVSAFHARLSFGPGQRLLEKGCWLVPGSGDAKAARWVTP